MKNLTAVSLSVSKLNLGTVHAAASENSRWPLKQTSRCQMVVLEARYCEAGNAPTVGDTIDGHCQATNVVRSWASQQQQLAPFEDLVQVRQVGHLNKGHVLGTRLGWVQNLQERVRLEVSESNTILLLRSWATFGEVARLVGSPNRRSMQAKQMHQLIELPNWTSSLLSWLQPKVVYKGLSANLQKLMTTKSLF